MSVRLVITHSDGRTGGMHLCGQRTADGWLAQVALEHHFQVLVGRSWPVYLDTQAELEQTILELRMLRDLLQKEVYEVAAWDDWTKESNMLSWNQCLEALEHLRNETGWQASFG